MQSPVRRRLTRILVALGLVSLIALPAAAPVGAADPVVLRVGTVQDLDAMNPYLTEYYVGWEVFGLNYQGLVDFGVNAEPIGGFAKSWTQDGNTWTFKIDPDLKWSDGKPATSEDARWTLQKLLDIQKGDRGYVGVGYLDLYLTYAAVKSVTAPDAQTLVLTTEYPNTQILTSYLPILPKHIWEKRDINTDANKVPVVGTGAYQAVEWKTGEYVRFVRNPNYQGPTPKSYQDETFIQFFKDEGAMTEALKSGDIDYARNVTSDQFESLKTQPNVVVAESTTAAEANAFTHLVFNTYSKPIEGGGASTTATRDPAFRDALGYAIDKPALVDKVLGGHGVAGSTIIPPAMSGGLWHLDPASPRTFDLDVARQKLDAAGYKLDASGNRLDHEGKPINLKMVVPSSSTTYTQSAEFISAWWKELGLGVTVQSLDADAVSALQKPPEADPPGKASFDVVIWNWAGDVDPNSLLKNATTDAIPTGNSDSFFSNARYDELFALQGKENDQAKRKTYIDEMQQILYDQAPYHVLFYDAALSAWRTDKFGGWPLSPKEGGLPFFAYGTAGYDYLTAPQAAAPSAEASAAASAAASPGGSQAAVATNSPAPSASTDSSTTSGSSNTLLLVGGIVLVIVAVVAVVGLSRRRSAAGEEE
jgi:peptide/nickel transport system substrate-binding protein